MALNSGIQTNQILTNDDEVCIHLCSQLNLSFSVTFQITGTAEYLNDEIQNDEFVRMTFSYNMIGKQVTAIAAENIQNSAACDSDDATHVVIEVKYGFNAFLLFETQSSETYSKEMIAGELKIMIKAIPAVSISGSGSMNLTDSQTEISESLRFRFHGDTVIDPPPQSFDEAIDVYQSLPAASLEDERVVSFSIAPLSDYCTAVDTILNDISSANIELVSNMMVDFEQVEKVLRRLKSSNLALDFQRYRLVLLDLEKRFEAEKSYFISEMQTLLPDIRSGDADDTDLTDLIDEYKASRYEKEVFLALLSTRQKEIETAEYIIYHEDLPSNTYVDLDNSGDMASCVIGHEYAVVYELEILPKNISALGDEYEAETLDESGKWFMDEEQVGANRPLMDDFIELAAKNADSGSASICFLITLNEYGESADAFQLKLLKGGETIIDGFEAPAKIWKMEEVARGVDSVDLLLYHNVNDLVLSSSYFELVVDYAPIHSDVSLNVKFI